MEEKERKDENKSKQATKKPPSKFYSKMEETRRILPIIDIEMKKKIEKADIVSKDKKDGIKKSRVSKLLCVI